MLKKFYTIRLDTMRSIAYTEAEYTQNDTETCGLHIELTHAGEPINLESSQVVIGFAKPSGKVVIDFATITDAETGKISYTFNNQVLAEAGVVWGIVQIYKQENKRLSTAKFKIAVTNDIITFEDIAKDNSYPVLTQLIEDFENATSKIPNFVEVANLLEGIENEYTDYINTIKPEALQAIEDVQAAVDTVNEFVAKQTIGSWSLTIFVENVSAELKVEMKAPSLYWNRWAVFADETNLSGILTTDEGFTSTPLAFESDRLTVRFFDERTYEEGQPTLICKLERNINLQGVKAGNLILVEEVNGA